MSRDIGNQVKRRRRLPLEVISVLFLFGAWVYSGVFNTAANQSTKVRFKDARFLPASELSAGQNAVRSRGRDFNRLGSGLTPEAGKYGRARGPESGALDLSTILQQGSETDRGNTDPRIVRAAKALTLARRTGEPRTVVLGKGVKVKIDGNQIFADVLLPLSKIVGIGFGDRMVNVSGEVFVESAGAQTRIYLKPSRIDGKEPPGIVRRMLRGMDLYDLFAKDYPIDAFLSHWSKRY